MAGEKHIERPKDSSENRRPRPGKKRAGSRADDISLPGNRPESGFTVFLRQHALTLIVFMLSLFFIITISNPALYMNDEWITANQLHQLDIGHQVTFSEGKYGVTENGTVSAYFIVRQNVLQYSLAFPLAALPVVKAFGLFGDNFRLLVIMGWSLLPVLIALLADSFYPAYARIRGVRILIPALALALLLFMGNVLLYKQFPFSAPDAPFEVAALVLTNHILFAVLVVTVFETSRLVLKDTRLALFGTFACISCSSYIFWAAAAKDHILTSVVLAGIVYLYIRYLVNARPADALYAFICCGLLIWVRPEIGFFVTVFSGLFFCISLFGNYSRKKEELPQVLRSLYPLAGAFIGGIPFFINNLIISGNPLVPVFDLPRSMELTGSAATLSGVPGNITAAPATIEAASGLDLPSTAIKLSEMVSHSMITGFTFDNLFWHFSGLLAFPENGSVGFVIMCPILVTALVALVLWFREIRDGSGKVLMVYLFIIAAAVFFSYVTKFHTLNTSHGVVPDMRYLSPAYFPAGLLSIVLLSRTPFLQKPGELLRFALPATIIMVPLSFIAMILVHPFGEENTGYFAFFEFLVLTGILLCSGMMILYRYTGQGNRLLLRAVPYILVLTVITVFSFQIMLTSVYAMVQKFNGYPFWLPIVREGFNLIFVVNYMPPV